MLTTLLFCLGPKGQMIQHERFVGTAIHQALSDAEIEFNKRYKTFRECFNKYIENIPCQPIFFRNVWYAHRAFDTLVATFQTLIDSIEDPDEKDWVLCKYQPRMEQLKWEFSDSLDYLQGHARGGNHPLGVPRANQSVLYYAFTPESTVKERLEEFDFMYVRAWDDCAVSLFNANRNSNNFCWHMADTQQACKEAEEALQTLLDGIDDPEEKNRVRDECQGFIWLAKNFANEREKFPWNKKSSSNFRMALIKKTFPEKIPWVVEQFPWKDPGPP